MKLDLNLTYNGYFGMLIFNLGTGCTYLGKPCNYSHSMECAFPVQGSDVVVHIVGRILNKPWGVVSRQGKSVPWILYAFFPKLPFHKVVEGVYN